MTAFAVRWHGVWFGVATAIVALVCGSPAAGQISPGKLARPHADLDGSLKCASCHAGRGASSAKCMACHKEIAWMVEQRRGLHAREATAECASCHPDHAGQEFSMISWAEGSAERFDHRRTGWRLDGKHADAKCSACHKQALQQSQAARLAKRQNPARSWLGMERDCIACHDDEHRGQLSRDCASCHDVRDWKPAARFDHAKTDYPLTGKHADVECADCHLAPRLNPKPAADGHLLAVYQPLGHAECSACHADPHRGRLGAICSECHETTSFTEIDKGQFNHALTRYPLKGKHATVGCEKCHGPAGRSKNPPFATCADCHSDAHAGTATLAGQAVDCDACHRVDGFTPSTYTVTQHQKAGYALEGKHEQVKCSACHPRETVATAASLGTARVRLQPRHAQCRDCHADDHAGQLASRPDHGACEACHQTAGWTRTTYALADHASFGLALEGRHAEVTCGACHGGKRAGLPPFANATALGRAAVAFKLSEADCADCHYDAHDRRYTATGVRPIAGGCGACHSARSFRSATVDVGMHERLGYRLEGAHRAVACVACHAAMEQTTSGPFLLLAASRPAPLSLTAKHDGCEACHKNPHGEQFATTPSRGRCESCHGLEGFAPASSFDHERDAAFSLKGAHAKVACAKCHTPAGGVAGTRRIVYRPVSSKCESCHGGTVPQGKTG